MYFVKYGNEYLHDPRIDKLKLFDLTLDCEENSCGFCDFTIYPDHPMYDKLKERDAENPIEVYDDGILLFAGFIYELGKEFYLDGHVKCKGELDYLNETIVRPYSTVSKGYGIKAPETVNGLFYWYIRQHNSQTDPSKQFTIGLNQGGSMVITNLIFEESNEYPTTIEEIKDKLLDKYKGYLRVRHENGVRYIDYLKEWTEANTQVLDFGVNLTDYTQTDDSADLATFVVPLGARMSDTLYVYDDGYFHTSDSIAYASKEYYTKPNDGYTRCEELEAFVAGTIYYENYHTYYVTGDTTPNRFKTYYTLTEDSTYTSTSGLTAWENGVTYYEQDVDGYYVTTDTTVDYDKQYYTRKVSSHEYSKCNDLRKFKPGVEYYEYDANEDESDLPLTVTLLSDGKTSQVGYTKSNDMVYSEDGVKKYGWIGRVYQNDDITTREELRDAGALDLKSAVSPKRTIEIKAVDMHLVNPAIKPIRIGEYVRVRSKPHNLDSYFLCASIDLDLNNPENSMYTLGTTFDTLTGEQNRRINELNATINKQYESALIEQAISDARNAHSLSGSAYQRAIDAATQAIDAKNRADALTERVSLTESNLTTVSESTQQALTYANEAITSAGTATAIANQIQSEIDDVQGDATDLASAIEGQIETKVTTMTADYARVTDLTATQTTLRSEISQSAAAVESTVEQTYAKMTDLTSVAADLQSQLRQTSSSIESVVSDVTAVQVDITTAQSAADQATSLANAAQSAANTAGSNATIAQNAAAEAKTAADDAQANVAALQSTVTSRFSAIEQTSSNISSSVGELQTDIDNIVIGGRNLLANTETPTVLAAVASDFNYNIFVPIPGSFEANVTYAISADVTVNTGSTSKITMGIWTADVTTSKALQQEIDIVNGKIKTCFRITNTTYTYTSLLLYAGIAGQTSGIGVTFSHIKLEKGTKPTDWLIAPEDAETRMSTVEQTVGGLSVTLTNTTTTANNANTTANAAAGAAANAATNAINAAKTATNFLRFSNSGLEVGDMTAGTLGKNVLIDEESIDLRNGSTVLAAFGPTGIRFEKAVNFTADGILINNGDAYSYLGRNTALYTSTGGIYMNAGQSISFATNLSRMISGAVFAWSYYNNGAAENTNWRYFFVPKSHVINQGGSGIYMTDPYLGMMKYIYVSNGGASGVAFNSTTGTKNGIAYDNSHYVLRYVYGV